jgi:1-acyl-sn-glycerol-3-phosphate acyltransferase
MTSTTPNFLHRAFYRLAAFLFFNRVTLRPAAGRPATGPLLFLGLHRNGALDAIPYMQATPHAAYLVSAQLHRAWLGRLAFPGIAVSRAKDRNRGIGADNDQANQRSVAHLVSGGQLFIMPEGTSTLGPRHLPFKPGAAHIAAAALAQGARLTVVPLAVHYECAWEWQSRIEVVLGAPIALWQPGPDGACDHQKIAQQVTAALEAIGVNVASEAELRFIEMLSYAATLGTKHSYSACLKHFEAGVPNHLRAAAVRLLELASQAGAKTHQGVPLVPLGPVALYLTAWLLLAPLMAAGFVLNLPPLAAGYRASRKLADDANVIAFWRAAIGLPVAALWATAMVIGLIAWGHALLALAYVALSLAGIRATYRFRKLSIALYNRLRAPQLAEPLRRFHGQLLAALAALPREISVQECTAHGN